MYIYTNKLEHYSLNQDTTTMDGQMVAILTKFLKKRTIALILILASIIVASIFVQRSEIITFLVFVVLIPIFAIFKFDGRIPLCYAVILMIIAGILTFIKQEGFVDELVVFVYWLLVVGISSLVIDWFRGKKWEVVQQ